MGSASTLSSESVALGLEIQSSLNPIQSTLRLDLRLPTELLLDILALSLPAAVPTSSFAPPCRELLGHLISLAPVCPLFLAFARKKLLRHPIVSTSAQADSLLQTLARVGGDARRLSVAAPKAGSQAVSAAQLVSLLEACPTVERVEAEELEDESDDDLDGGALPRELWHLSTCRTSKGADLHCTVESTAYCILPRALFNAIINSHEPVAARPSLPRLTVCLRNLRHLSLHSSSPLPSSSALESLLSPKRLPSLQHLSLDRFPSTVGLRELAPSLRSIRGSYFAPDLDLVSCRAVCYTGSLCRTSYNLPPSTQTLYLPAMGKCSSVPWIVSEVLGCAELKELHVLKLGVEGSAVRQACKDRQVRLVEIDLAEQGERGTHGGAYWDKLVREMDAAVNS